MLVNELLGKLDCSHAELDYIVICCDGEYTCFGGNTFRGQNLIKMPDYLNKEVQCFSFFTDFTEDCLECIDDGMLPIITTTLWIEVR